MPRFASCSPTAYDEVLRSRMADLVNAGRDRRAHPIQGATFLAASRATCRGRISTSRASRTTAGARTRPRAAAGFGVRLLVELARAVAGADR